MRPEAYGVLSVTPATFARHVKQACWHPLKPKDAWRNKVKNPSFGRASSVARSSSSMRKSIVKRTSMLRRNSRHYWKNSCMPPARRRSVRQAAVRKPGAHAPRWCATALPSASVALVICGTGLQARQVRAAWGVRHSVYPSISAAYSCSARRLAKEASCATSARSLGDLLSAMRKCSIASRALPSSAWAQASCQ